MGPPAQAGPERSRQHDRDAADIPQALAATAGPAQVIPVAFLGRTSNERFQDPVASMRRQVRNSLAWLPKAARSSPTTGTSNQAGTTWKTGDTPTPGRWPPPPGSPATGG